MQEVWQAVKFLLGIGPEENTVGPMILRAGLIYLATLIAVRVGEKRFLGKSTAFDVVLGIILGSIESRAINGKAPLIPTIVSGFVLVAIHWIFAEMSFRSESFGTLIKGHVRQLVKKGQIQWPEMHTSHISQTDLMSAIRKGAHTTDITDVDDAYLERSGEISLVTIPKVLEVKVEEGVQTIRILVE